MCVDGGGGRGTGWGGEREEEGEGDKDISGCQKLEARGKAAERDSVIFKDELEIIYSFVRVIPTHLCSQLTLPGRGGPLLPFGGR